MNQARSGLEVVFVLSRIESEGCGMSICPVPLELLLTIVTVRTTCPAPLAATMDGVMEEIEFPVVGVKVMLPLVGGVWNPMAMFDAVAVIRTTGLPE